MSNPYENLEDIFEPFIAQIKAELEELGIFDDISEGETVYDDAKGKIAWVIPGNTVISHSGMQSLEHRMTLYVVGMMMDQESTLAQMRAEIGYPAYNKLMEDVKHNDTCWVCMPRGFHPGFMQYGDYAYCGVLMTFEARFRQSFALPP